MTDRSVHICRANDRFHVKNDWLDGFHSLNPHEPNDRPFGHLLTHTDDTIAPASGFRSHRHEDVEIITWMLAGCLQHQDSTGALHELQAGEVQCMSAGSGIEHAERNPSESQPARLIQMAIAPARQGGQPSYQTVSVAGALSTDGLITIASGYPGDQPLLSLKQQGARLSAARLEKGDRLTIPDSHWGHLYVIRGAIDIATIAQLQEGDSLRLINYGAVVVKARTATEILVWEMNL